MTQTLRASLTGLLPIIVLLAIWWIVSDGLSIVDAAVLPSPVAVVEEFIELVQHPFAGHTLPFHAGASLGRWALGFAIAILLGVPIGAAVAWFPLVRGLFSPPFEFLRYIPPYAWVPIAILWMGASLRAEAAVVFIAAFPPCVINTARGIASVDGLYLSAARTLGAGRIARLRTVAFPLALPMVLAGIRIAISNGWMALMGAELIAGRTGLGFLINTGQTYGRPTVIISGMITIALLGLGLDALVRKGITPLTAPWRREAA